MCETLHEIIRHHSRPLAPLATGQAPVLQFLPGIKAILFDIYGTLLVSASGEIGTSALAAREAAFSAAFEAMDLGLKCTPSAGVERFVATIRGVHEKLHGEGIAFPEVDILDVWKQVLAELYQNDLISRPSEDENALKQLAVEYEVRVNPVWPMAGCIQVLETLIHAGLRLGIISNAQFFTPELFPALLENTLGQLGFRPELQLFSYRYGRAKPDLRMFELAASILSQEFACGAGEVLYVGNDVLNDVYPARTVGFRTALFAGDSRSFRQRSDNPRLAGVTSDLVITELGQLIPCVLRGEVSGTT